MGWIIAGVVFLAIAVHARIERAPGSHWYVNDEPTGATEFTSSAGVALVIMPALGLFTLGYGIYELAGGALGTLAGSLGLLALFLMLPAYISCYFTAVLGPKFYRERWRATKDRDRKRKARAKKKSSSKPQTP